jgi:hypothetical protein
MCPAAPGALLVVCYCTNTHCPSIIYLFKERFSSHFWVATFHALEGPYQAGVRGTAYRLRGRYPSAHTSDPTNTTALLHQYLIQVHAMGIPQTSTWQTGVNLFKNVFFFKAFLPGLETEVRGFFW